MKEATSVQHFSKQTVFICLAHMSISCTARDQQKDTAQGSTFAPAVFINNFPAHYPEAANDVLVLNQGNAIILCWI